MLISRSLDEDGNVVYHSYEYPHCREVPMRTIQMTLDDELVDNVDEVVKKLKTTRSAFARKALNDAIRKVNSNLLEQKHKKGYGQRPADGKEFSVWESEQAWGDK